MPSGPVSVCLASMSVATPSVSLALASPPLSEAVEGCDVDQGPIRLEPSPLGSRLPTHFRWLCTPLHYVDSVHCRAEVPMRRSVPCPSRRRKSGRAPR
ncbi:hypothetical protein BGZ61DRAFT_460264 [Ilyonectria robusta]|uniref:uncharacterized protein n=1 Tax=Ilyonectria robusta TaxID=1079257 RepID=UPI001E8ECF17|nr:uncharacterized protein BGZ61DRAFT_460264 [Ilyonectria robusta]KAH8669943.1 hypothetical protein BGZ61DRAFT_460264 [Ilyonectria robusta]